MAAEIPVNGVAYFFFRYTRATRIGDGSGSDGGGGKSGKKR